MYNDLLHSSSKINVISSILNIVTGANFIFTKKRTNLNVKRLFFTLKILKKKKSFVLRNQNFDNFDKKTIFWHIFTLKKQNFDLFWLKTTKFWL